MAEHRPDIQRLGEGLAAQYRATCSCGWEYQEVLVFRSWAAAEAQAHLDSVKATESSSPNGERESEVRFQQQVCTRCWAAVRDIEPVQHNWEPGRLATVKFEDGVFYVVPHLPTCSSLYLVMHRDYPDDRARA